MLKLLKYEIIQSWRNFLIVFLCYLALCILVPTVNWSNMNELEALLVLIYVVTVMGISIGVFITIATNYKKTMFEKNGYLTLTLPVNSIELLLSKLIAGVFWILLSGLVLFIGFSFISISLVGIDLAKEAFEGLVFNFENIFREFGLIIVQIIFTFLTSLITLIMLLFFSLTLAHSSLIRNHRNFWGIVIFFGINIIFSSLLNDIFGVITFQNMYLGSNSIKAAVESGIWYQILLDILQFTLYTFGTWYILEKKLEVQ